MRILLLFLFAIPSLAHANELTTWMQESVPSKRADIVAMCLEHKLTEYYYSSTPYTGFVVLRVVSDTKNGRFRIDVVGDAANEAQATNAIEKIRSTFDLVGRNCTEDKQDAIRSHGGITYRSMKNGELLKTLSLVKVAVVPK